MSGDIINTRVICEGGLNTNENDLILSPESPGCATRLVNFETSASGGYRRINGYVPFDLEYPEVAPDEAEGPVLGIFGFQNTVNRQFELFAARKDKSGNTYSIYKHLPHSGWEKQVLPNDREMVGIYETVYRLRWERINYGGGSHLLAVDGVNKALWYDGTDWREISSSATAPDAGGDQAIDSPSLITAFKNHIFVARGDGNESIIAHSAPIRVDDWTVASGAGQIFPGFDVKAIKAWRDELFVFGEYQIKKIVAEGTTFVLKDVTSEIGCIATDSVLEVGGSLVFLSQDGIRPVAGTDRINDVELGLLSRDIQPEMENLIANGDLKALVGIPIKKKTQFRYFYSSGLVPVDEARGVIGSIRVNRRIQRSWEFGTLLGMRASCTWSGPRVGRELNLIGDYDGKVYQIEVGNSFDGRPIFSIYRTPYLDLGDTEIRKTFHRLNLWLHAEGPMDMAIGVEGDWNDIGLILPTSYEASSAGSTSLYDDIHSRYDSVGTLYGGVDRLMVPINIQGSYFSARFSFVSNGVLAPYTIQGFVPEFSAKGRQ